MAYWDKFRREADLFDVEYELTKFDESTIKTYRETIKLLKKYIRVPHIMGIRTHRIRKRILIPKESARQRAMTDGIFTAYKESIDIFMDADKFAKDPYETLKTLANKIKLRRRELDIAREQYDDKKTKSIYNEMFLTIEIVFLIDVWRTFLNQEKGFIQQK